MEVTRKGFITSVGTALAAAVALPSNPVFAGAFTAAGETGATTFSDHIGSSFEMTRADGTRAGAILREVVRGKSDRRTDQFSLVFSTREGAALPQGIYKTRHAHLGSADMFLVPGGRESSASLRADFNRLKA